jgi:ABC-type lipoprotein export system ATPase subunit
MCSERVEDATNDPQPGRTTAPARQGVSLAVDREELMTVAGRSGSGRVLRLADGKIET